MYNVHYMYKIFPCTCDSDVYMQFKFIYLLNAILVVHVVLVLQNALIMISDIMNELRVVSTKKTFDKMTGFLETVCMH